MDLIVHGRDSFVKSKECAEAGGRFLDSRMHVPGQNGMPQHYVLSAAVVLATPRQTCSSLPSVAGSFALA